VLHMCTICVCFVCVLEHVHVNVSDVCGRA